MDRDSVLLEPDRFELREPPAYSFALDRREFLEVLGAGVIVLVVAPRLPLLAQQQEIPQNIGAWLHLAADGSVTVFTGKVEVGQDIRTSLTQAVAEELRIAPDKITLIMGDTDLVPYDAGTFGSRSTPQMGTQLRRAAAAARELIERRAAEVKRGEKIVQMIPSDVATIAPSQWKVAGTSLPKVNGRDIVTGKHRYPSDIKLRNMMIGKVLRAPAFGAELVSVDASVARAMRNVAVVTDGNFIGVAAPDEATANRAVASIKAEWRQTPQVSQRDLFEHLKRSGAAGNPQERGDVHAALAAADERMEATYHTPYIAHVPLEPRAAVAQWEGDKLTVWTGTQRPFGVRTELARAFSLPQQRVRVIMPDTGSGYGGKHTGECALEAARLARAAGRPVKLVWTREEEFTWAYFRPAALVEIKSGVQRDGTLTAWEFHNYNSGAAALRTPYNVSHQKQVYHPADTPLRQGSYRALAATANNFARESQMDELAARVNMDPLAFRLKNLREERMRNVLQAAADKFGWPHKNSGVACGTDKGGYVACCVEVSANRATGKIEVLRIVQAFECGAIVNPDGLRNQVEGAVVMGLGGALWETVEFESGRVLNPRLSQYRVPRFSDVPPIEIVLLDRKDLPSAGAGETPIIALAPAIGNAVKAATGVRLTALPFKF